MRESVVFTGPATLAIEDDRIPNREAARPVEATEQELRLIPCKICGRELREITTMHLRLAHGWKEETVVERYKRTFNVESVRSSLTLATRQEVGMTEDRLKREILRIRRVGGSLNTKNMIKSHHAIYLNACKAYGSWEKALSRCGIEYDAVRLRKRWTRTKVLDWITDRDVLDLDLRSGTVKKEEGGVHTAACREFGSWKEALVEAGVRSGDESDPECWSTESILAGLQEYGPGITERELRGKDAELLSRAKRHFGGFFQALRAANLFVPKAKVPKWTRGRILGAIRSRIGTGVPLVPRVFVDLGEMPKAAVDLFGSWDEALKAAGAGVQ
jgi:hypothetical protein